MWAVPRRGSCDSPQPPVGVDTCLPQATRAGTQAAPQGARDGRMGREGLL